MSKIAGREINPRGHFGHTVNGLSMHQQDDRREGGEQQFRHHPVVTKQPPRRANGVDGWAIYRALSEPYEVLEGRSPVEAITAYNLREVASAVLGALGLN